MRILISGGVKTNNIVEAIKPKFAGSGDEITVVYYLEDIPRIFASGDYFDKAIIIEQSITRDGTIREESEIRSRIYKFVQDMVGRLYLRKMSFVFLARTDDICELIHEEVLDIMDYSVVIKKQTPYFVAFFINIIVTDVKQCPEDLVFKPNRISFEQQIESDTKSEASSNIFESIRTDKIQHAGDNFGESLFGGYDTYTEDEESDDNDEMPELDEDENELEDDYDVEEQLDEEEYGEEEYGEEEQLDGEGQLDEDSYEVEDGGYDEQLDCTGYEQEYTESQQCGVSNRQQITGGVTYDGTGHLEGFDDYEVEEDTYYSDSEIDSEDIIDSEDDNTDSIYGIADSEFSDGFGESLYSEDSVPCSNEFPVNDTTREVVNDNTENKKKRLGILLGRNKKKENTVKSQDNKKCTDTRELLDVLRPFASRGNSIVVTGCGGCGTSTVAYNLANTAVKIGYTALIVDMDVNGKTQSYISKNSYEAMDIEGANLMAAVNSSVNIQSNVVVIKEGLHLLTMGLATDYSKIEDIIHKERVSRFVSVAKTVYNFIIYDIPFEYATDYLSDITLSCENLLLVVDSSNWGITKTMLNVCNIESEDMQDIVFSKSQIVFNKYKNLSKLFGQRIKTEEEITRLMDRRVIELVGEDIGLKFSSMPIAGAILSDDTFENCWYDSVQYSDTRDGFFVFANILENTVLKKNV